MEGLITTILEVAETVAKVVSTVLPCDDPQPESEFYSDADDEALLEMLLPDVERIQQDLVVLGEEIGTGGDGVKIIRATNTQLQSEFVVKRIPLFTAGDDSKSWESEGRVRLERLCPEVKLMRQIQDESRNFVNFHGTGLFRSKDGSRELWIAMDLVDGVDLSRIVEGSEISIVSPDELCGVAAFLAYTLSILHDCHVVHRDVKSANVLLSRQGWLKLIDFDIAFTLDSPNSKPEFLAGSPAYMAPEMLFVGEEEDFTTMVQQGYVPDHGYKIDIWALGLTLLELLFSVNPMVAITQDDYELVSEYMNGIGCLDTESILGTLLRDLFAEDPDQEQKFLSLVGLEERQVDFEMSVLLDALNCKDAILNEFAKEGLSNAELLHFIAECLTFGEKERPAASVLVKHQWVELAVLEVMKYDNMQDVANAAETYPASIGTLQQLFERYDAR